MSNPSVGSVYQQIIRDVVETSRVDFEEGGVDESVLEELRKGWEMKLSALGVAQFPWDPKPEPAPAPVISNPPPVASNYHQMDTPPQPQSTFSLPPLPPMQSMNDNANGPRIKTEPGAENGLNLPSFSGGSGMTAQQRAAQNLQATYGSRAAASINAIQSNLPQQAQQQGHPQSIQQQQQQQQRPSGAPISRPPLTQYQQAMAEQAARQRQQLQNMGSAQTDGAGDMEDEPLGIMKRFNGQGQEVEVGRVEIDHIIRRKIEAMGQRMEGGGLMLPLQERAPAGRNKKRRITVSEAFDTKPGSNTGPGVASSSRALPQFDGGDEDDDDKSNVLKEEDFDEDAINSDLDDPDEELNEDDDDDEVMGHIMLCMYDKVQRVKNKWKCVMKDGVLTVNGKEYVFHRATGEYEW